MAAYDDLINSVIGKLNTEMAKGTEDLSNYLSQRGILTSPIGAKEFQTKLYEPYMQQMASLVPQLMVQREQQNQAQSNYQQDYSAQERARRAAESLSTAQFGEGQREFGLTYDLNKTGQEFNQGMQTSQFDLQQRQLEAQLKAMNPDPYQQLLGTLLGAATGNIGSGLGSFAMNGINSFLPENMQTGDYRLMNYYLNGSK